MHLEMFKSDVFSLYMILSGRRPLGRPSHRWEDDITKCLRDRGCEHGNQVEQAQDRVQFWAVVVMMMTVMMVMMMMTTSSRVRQQQFVHDTFAAF
jgi:hypothetical protein